MTLCSFVPCTRGIGVLWLPVIYYLSSGSHRNSVTSHCSVSATLHWQFCVSTSSGFIASDSTAIKPCYDCICLQHWYWLRVEILVDIGKTGTKNVVNHWAGSTNYHWRRSWSSSSIFKPFTIILLLLQVVCPYRCALRSNDWWFTESKFPRWSRVVSYKTRTRSELSTSFLFFVACMC